MLKEKIRKIITAVPNILYLFVILDARGPAKVIQCGESELVDASDLPIYPK